MDQRYTFSYIYGAVEPGTDNAFALVMPDVNTDNMQVFVDEFAKTIPASDHVALFIDGAGWHTTGGLKFPANITPIRVPPYSPDTNPVERVWEFLKEKYLSQRLLNDYDAIADAACIAWNKLTAEAGRLTSLTWLPWQKKPASQN
jgi:transposase